MRGGWWVGLGTGPTSYMPESKTLVQGGPSGPEKECLGPEFYSRSVKQVARQVTTIFLWIPSAVTPPERSAPKRDQSALSQQICATLEREPEGQFPFSVGSWTKFLLLFLFEARSARVKLESLPWPQPTES